MKIITSGASRIVLIIGNLVFKIPVFNCGFKYFLNGLLCNLQEVDTYKFDHLKFKLCPILFSLPLGLLVVMPKVKILDALDDIPCPLEEFCKVNESWAIDVENKCDSFGWYNDNLVAIDYGGWHLNN